MTNIFTSQTSPFGVFQVDAQQMILEGAEANQ